MAGSGRSLILTCGTDGAIRRVLRDDFRPTDPIEPDRLFVSLLDPASVSKGLDFLTDARRQGAASGRDLNLLIGDRPASVCFTGVAAAGGELIIVGTAAPLDLEALCDIVLALGEKQRRAFCAGLSGKVAPALFSSAVDLDEFSRINNELTNAHREIARKSAQLARLSDQKSRLLGMLGHDLRNQLTVVWGFSELLLATAGAKLDPDEVRLVNRIVRATEAMRRIVDSLLGFGQIEAGRLQLDRRDADLVALVRDGVALYEPVAEEKGIAVAFAPPDRPVLVRMDSDKIEQVLNNLISNAIKYSDSGARITVSIAPREDDAVVAVADEGQGIAPDELKLLFQPFSRTSNRPTGDEPSSGLGLYIVKHVVEAHGGRVWVDSAPGRGSTFSFSLPYAADGG